MRGAERFAPISRGEDFLIKTGVRILPRTPAVLAHDSKLTTHNFPTLNSALC